MTSDNVRRFFQEPLFELARRYGLEEEARALFSDFADDGRPMTPEKAEFLGRVFQAMVYAAAEKAANVGESAEPPPSNVRFTVKELSDGAPSLLVEFLGPIRG